MKAGLSFSDIIDNDLRQIEEMRRVGESFPSAEAYGACAAFTRQVRLLESAVVHNYRVAAVLARKADDLKEAAEVWSRMSQFCQAALQALAQLKDKYPHCGTPELYDLALDYKLAADKRLQGVEEELACQRTDFPKGLLPELS